MCIFPIFSNNHNKLGEEFSYTVNTHGNILYLTFATANHDTVRYEIDLSSNLNAYGVVDEHDHPGGYTGDYLYYKAGAYNQCSTKNSNGPWYAGCAGTGDWKTDKANGDYTEVKFSRLMLGPSEAPAEKTSHPIKIDTTRENQVGS